MKLVLISLVAVALARVAFGLAFHPGAQSLPLPDGSAGAAPVTCCEPGCCEPDEPGCCEPGCCEPGCCAEAAAAPAPLETPAPSSAVSTDCCGGACPPACCAPSQV